MIHTAYLYKWTQLSTGKWYIGSQTGQNAHPDDGYLCSSKIVKPLIQSNSNDWKRQIMAVGYPGDIYKRETDLLKFFDAKNDPMSFNQHNGDGKFRSKKGGTKKKVVCRLIDRQCMTLRNFNEYCDRQDNPKKYKDRNKEQSLKRKGVPSKRKGIKNPKVRVLKLGIPNTGAQEKLTGVPKKKVLCRLFDKKEMDLANFTQWINRQDDPLRFAYLANEKSKATKGIKKPSLQGRPAHNRGKASKTLRCPHCSKIGAVNLMPRYHFDNCKYKKEEYENS